jgi:predicted RNA binding protein YcfA (HicA-like mRNA interferase family)
VSPRLKQLSGDDVVSVFASLGFTVHSQRGSHVKLRRVTATGQKQTLTVPRHRELDSGTLRAIIRQASRYLTEAELQPHFYLQA